MPNSLVTFIIINQPNIRDKLSPLEYEIHLRIKETNVPSVAKLQQPIIRDAFNIVKNCGSDDLCEPNLRISAKADSKYILGSKDLLEIAVTVENNGEDAHQTAFYMTMPVDVNFLQIERLVRGMSHPVHTGSAIICTTRSGSPLHDIKCDIGNPLAYGEVVRFKVLLSSSPVEGMAHTLPFDMKVNSTNPENDILSADNYFSVKIPIQVDTNLSVKGESINKPVQYRSSDYLPLHNATTGREIGPQVVNIYEIHNVGVTPVKEAEVIFSWPHETVDGDSLLYLMLQPETSTNMQCERSKEANERHIYVNRTLIPRNFFEKHNKSLEQAQRIRQRDRGAFHLSYNRKRRDYVNAELLNPLLNGESSIRCTATELKPNSSAWIAVYMRIVARTADFVRQMNNLGEISNQFLIIVISLFQIRNQLTQNGSYNLSTKVEARVSKVAYYGEPPEKPWKGAEVKFQVIRDPEPALNWALSDILNRLWLITLSVCVGLFVLGGTVYLLYLPGNIY